MRDSIMHMQYVQFLEAHHIYQATGQGKLVRRIFEQWIFGNGYLVEKKDLRKEIEPCRQDIGHKMNQVPIVGQSFAEFGSYNAAAAKSGITNYSDFHLCDLAEW